MFNKILTSAIANRLKFRLSQVISYGSSKRPCIIIIFLSCFIVITTSFSHDLDITKVVLSLSRLIFSRDLDITKVVLSLSRHKESCGSQRKNRFLTT